MINVGDTASTCRVTSEVKGNPVVKGDVIANAIYDPNKQYKFVAFGNFDTNRDGLVTNTAFASGNCRRASSTCAASESKMMSRC